MLTADGERERELTDAEVAFEVRESGPRIVDVRAVFEAAEAGLFSSGA